MQNELPFCECGCGERVTKIGNRFISGHNSRNGNHPMANPDTRKKVSITKTGVPRSPFSQVWRDNIGKSRRGKKLSPGHCTAISKGLMGISRPPFSQDWLDALGESITKTRREHPEIWDKSREKQRGGNDIVGHHFLYDHNDLTKYVIDMTRSDHVTLHNHMRGLRLKISHIHTGCENEDEIRTTQFIDGLATKSL